MAKTTRHTGKMPWDDIWDFSHYKISKVRKIVRRYVLKKQQEK